MTASKPSLALTHARVITPTEEIEDATVVLAGGRIVSVGPEKPPAEAETLDVRGRTVAPGFIDLHVHGGGGFSLTGGDLAEVGAYAHWAVSRGVTSFLISLVPGERDELLRRIRATLPAFGGVIDGAQPLGFHLEGPFLSPKRPGAFAAEGLRAPDVEELRGYVEVAEGRVRIVTLAPELLGGEALIDAVVEAGAVAALGHSDATYEEAQHAFALGVRHVTHCYNAMRPFHQRDPGCLAAALNSRDVTVELIADGVHVHPGAMELLLRAKGVERTVLVSDGIPLAGTGDGVFDLQGEEIRVEGGVARRVDGALAGGTATMDEAVRNAAAWLPVSRAEAVRMATLNPAAAIGLDGRKGRVAPGFDADLVVLSPALEVEMTFVAGKTSYRR
ncbi:MAG: N-acetylglucosamine-6-phosphate deacetylase [Dehalococcoidia bacterium]|jgi:N-acetylglucosamine-6-phosphate deacetylase